MPVSPTYPGVYVQEVDSGSRTVSGVATSITAFIGRAPMGPENYPTMVYDYGEFQKAFGGRARDLPMTYAVEDFFNNGGSQALVVRVCAGAPLGTKSLFELKTDDPKYVLKTKLTGPVSGLVLMTAEASTKKPGTYTLTFRLGSATSKLVLARFEDIAPEAVDMTLKRSSVVDVTYAGAPLDPDARTVQGRQRAADPGADVPGRRGHQHAAGHHHHAGRVGRRSRALADQAAGHRSDDADRDRRLHARRRPPVVPEPVHARFRGLDRPCEHRRGDRCARVRHEDGAGDQEGADRRVDRQGDPAHARSGRCRRGGRDASLRPARPDGVQPG
jgi:hypothetical protein